uniref:Uncharacterized protein n=1 Tax=Raphanus sativus TaxID=3726 RepID=A0A650GAW5_RAPSA|nr:hypothetical protein [Raphanus sativus]QGW48614.1 hypothetical protein [Raphanus sativus]
MRKRAILLLLEQHRGPIWCLGRLDKACIQQVCQLLPKFCQFQGRHPIRCTCRGASRLINRFLSSIIPICLLPVFNSSCH